MNRPAGLTAKIKVADAELRNYVIELEKEISMLQKRLAKLQVQNVTQQEEIKKLQKEIKLSRNVESKGALAHLTPDEIIRILKETKGP